MTTSALIITVGLGVTVLAHLVLMFVRGWLLSEVRMAQNKMQREWEEKQDADEKWKQSVLTYIDQKVKAPWDIISRRTG